MLTADIFPARNNSDENTKVIIFMMRPGLNNTAYTNNISAWTGIHGWISDHHVLFDGVPVSNSELFNLSMILTQD